MEAAVAQNDLKIIRTIADIEPLREFWTSQPTHRDADLAFYLFFLGTTREVIRPHVIALYRDHLPYALLVGRLEERRLDIKIGYFRLWTRKFRTLTFVYQGLLGDQSELSSESFIRSILKALRDGEADVAMLHSLDVSMPLFRLAISLPRRRFSDRVTTPEVHRATELRSVKGTFLNSLSQKARYQQRRKTKALAEEFQGNVRIECFTREDQVGRLMQDAEVVACKSYQRGLGVGFSDTEFMRQRLTMEAGKGWLRGYVLYLGDQPCSFWITSLCDNVLHSNVLGFDPSYAKYSPGMYLVIKVIEDIHDHHNASQPTEVDFGLGEAEFKERLSNRSWWESSVYIFAPTLLGFSVNSLRTLVALSEKLMRTILEKSGLLSKVKRVWRARMRRE
jgi:CelD/BcsL family acetyltransferase involved in cellulose biosynthesis